MTAGPPGLDAAAGRRLAARRLRVQHLVGPPVPSPGEAVRAFGAVQAQDYGPAKWSLGVRTDGWDEAAVERLADRGELLRTHVLRPTWHVVAPEDIGWLLELTAPRVHALNAFMYRRTGVDAGLRGRVARRLATELRGGASMTRAEVAALLRRDGVEATGPRLAYLVMHAELEGVVCSGPRRGAQHTYALLAERAPGARVLPREDALAELTLRYFASRGPASAGDFAAWSSLSRADVASGLDAAGDRLRREQVGPLVLWSASGGLDPDPGPGPRVHLLQGLDEYVIGYQETRGALDVAEVARTGLPPGARPSNALVFVGGQLAGRWRRAVRRADVLVEIQPYAAGAAMLAAAGRDAVQAAADGLARFLGRPAATVQVHPVHPA